MDNTEEFVQAIQEVDPQVTDLTEALFVAMENVSQYPTSTEIRYFGPIGDCVFFTGSDFETCRWMPDTNVVEALEVLQWDVGPEAVEGIELFTTA